MKSLIFLASAMLIPEGSLSVLSGNDRASNPIIWADVPDPAVIRVGDVYYMSSTTMHMSPGLPIMKSSNLVDWELVGYAYDTLVDNDAMNLENGSNAYGRGSWASSLRYHEGRFIVSTFSATSGKTHIYTTEDIENGPWDEIAFAPSLHDHSLFFDDDGRVYMVYGAGDIRLVELNSDLSGLKPGGIDKVIVPDAGRIAGGEPGLPAEGAHLRKIDGRYYLMTITWPRGGMRTALVHRADTIDSPYEGRVALRDQGVAQGGLIDTPDGKWYAFLFRDNGAVGRVPYLVPVVWQDGWPILGNDGKAPTKLEIPSNGAGFANIVASDEFGSPQSLPLAWQWNHNPDPRYWSNSERPGWLRLRTDRVDSGVVDTRNTLTQRTFGPTSSAWTKLDASGLKDGDYAGLAALQLHHGFVGVVASDGRKSVVMMNAETGDPVLAESRLLTAEVVHLRIDCDFRDLHDTARFYFSLDGVSWERIGPSLKLRYTLPHFMGYRFGLFAFASKSPGGHADFDFYRIGSELVESDR